MSCDEFKCLYSLSPLPDSGGTTSRRGLTRTYSEDHRATGSRGFLDLGAPGLRGYFEVSKVMDSKTFKKYFARGRMEVSSSGGENIASGDESESCPSRGDLQCRSPSRGDLQCRSPSRIDSVERSILEMTPMTPPPRRAKWILRRGKEAMPHPPPKRTKSNKGAINVAGQLLAPGGPSTSPTYNLSPGASMMSSASVARKILNGVAPSDSAELEMVKAQNQTSQAEGQLADLGEKAMKTEAEPKGKSEAMARTQLRIPLPHTLTRVSNSARGSSSTITPNLGVDLASI
ncbi:hypothetical protein Acr_13g0006080 [Actinidia rufa]|uniref:Uncharacterized protein n=1 Tax=Actinidia rufa TaxID=165716 RepID=A0A7J0FMP0_9ERIC|nr:hypothetical protein Acr_13g0006080 [Actinidia rufa]